MFVFVKGVEGVSKANKAYQVITLAQYVESNGKVKCRLCEFFPARKLDLGDFDFGDIVECAFKEPEFVGDFPTLLDCKIAYQSPYVDLIQRKKVGIDGGKASKEN